MKKGCFACLAIFLLFIAPPLFAQGNDSAAAGEPAQMAASQPAADPGPAADQGVRGQPSGAAPLDMHHGYGREAGMGRFLNLSKDQMERSRAVWTRYFADTHNLRYDLMRERVEMKQLFTDPKADSAALLAKQKQLSATKQQLADRRAQAAIEWRNLLTPQQIQRLDMMLAAHRWMGHMGHGMGQSGGMCGGMTGHEMAPGMGHEMGRGMMGREMSSDMSDEEIGDGVTAQEMAWDSPGEETGPTAEGEPMSSAAAGSPDASSTAETPMSAQATAGAASPDAPESPAPDSLK